MGSIATQSYFWPILFASFGGFVVVVGLVLELLAEKKWFKNLRSLRFWNSAKTWGERLVIIGIVFEIADAGWTAHEIKHAETIAAKNDPLKQPISFLSANADCAFSFPFDALFHRAIISPEKMGNMPVAVLKVFNSQDASKTAFFMVTQDAKIVEDWEESSTMQLHFEDIPDLSPPLHWVDMTGISRGVPRASERIKGEKVEFIDGMDSAELDVYVMESNVVHTTVASWVGGAVVLMANDHSKTFVFPKQKLEEYTRVVRLTNAPAK